MPALIETQDRMGQKHLVEYDGKYLLDERGSVAAWQTFPSASDAAEFIQCYWGHIIVYIVLGEDE